MKKAEYKVVTGEKGIKDMEKKVTSMLNLGWKAIGGISFNRGYPYQALGRIIEKKEDDIKKEKMNNNEAMKKLDELF